MFWFLIFVFFACVSGSDLVPRNGRRVKNPCPDYMVEMIVSEKTDLSEFRGMMADIELEFADVYFEERDISDVPEYKNRLVPILRSSCRDEWYEFKYVMNKAWIRRWIRDGREGYFELIRKISASDEFHGDFKASIHVIGQRPPNILSSAKRMPSVGIGWTPLGGKVLDEKSKTKFRNTIITSDIYGRLGMRHNWSANNLLHILLPPIIPYEMAISDLGNEIMSALSDREIHIVSDRTLPDFWSNMVTDYPLTAFIQFDPYDTDLPNGTVWYFRRSLEFMYQGVDTGVRGWLHQVAQGRAEPLERRSLAPTVKSEHLFDVTGDNLLDWIKQHEVVFLHLYDAQTPPCEMRNVENGGRMDLRFNDHEILPHDATPGMVLHIMGHGRHITIKNCQQVESGLTYTQIKEQQKEKRIEL